MGWNLPPGVSVFDIPGNRPEDEEPKMLTWVKVIGGYRSDNDRYYIERDQNRHYTLMEDGIVICRGTLKKCKDVAQDRENETDPRDGSHIYDENPQTEPDPRTPDSELGPSELEDQPEEVEKNRVRDEYSENWDYEEEDPTGVGKLTPKLMPSAERNTARDPIDVPSPCKCNTVFRVTGRRTKQRERPRRHGCKECGKQYAVDVSNPGNPVVKEI